MDKFDRKPSILIVSSSNIKPKSLIKLITGATNISEDDADKAWHGWRIDTKYYTVDVTINGITEGFKRTEEFNNTVEAFIIHMDSNKESGLTDLEKWAVIETDCDPEIKLLVANYCTPETKITKAKATEWCLKRGFELIELYPAAKKPSEDDGEIIKEKRGVDRIVEALQTHVWPNLTMKDPQVVGASGGGDVAVVGVGEGSETADASSAEMDSSLLSDFLTDEGADDFTELFSQLHTIKESIKSMPTSQRKQCAEQMVTAFWRAIGGDEEEITDV